jgi:hypothetical protein
MLPAAGAGFAGSFAGAWAVTVMSADFLRKLLPLVLLFVLVYTLAKKELGRHHTPRFAGRTEIWVASLIGVLVGFYDGFFGPGTGSFFVWATTFSMHRHRPSCSTAPPTSRPLRCLLPKAMYGGTLR